jgi:hypothetical protein
LRDDLDYSRIVRPTQNNLDNSSKTILKYNKEVNLNKEKALELLIKYLKPEEINGTIYYSHIGEYITDKNGAFVFTVYPYTSKSAGKTYDPTYAFVYFVEKETREISSASAPLFEDELNRAKEQGEKINISIT